MKKKWYVGSDSVLTPRYSNVPYREGVWAKDSLEEAIEHARDVLEHEKDKKQVFIVEIVKVVRRPKLAVEIEDIE